MSLLRSRASRKVLVALLMPIALIGALFTAARAVAATDSLTIAPIEWNVVGLDSNDVSVGPNQYSVGAQVCNITGVALANVTVAWGWSTTNTYINIDGSLSKTIANLDANTCKNLWWTVEVTRNSAAYDTTRGFTVTASATDVNSVSTPTAREIYVEHLVSQERNGTDSLSGPTTVTVGQTVTYVLDGYTATNGYEQLSAGPTLDGSIFEVQSVAATYNIPTGATNTHFYADACGWDPVTTSGTYRSCIGPIGYTGGKAGGDPIQVTVVAEVIAAGTGYVSGNIYDFSGSSYHYNSDANLIVVTSTAPAPPVAVDDSAATASGVGVPIDVPSNDSDADGDLDVTSVSVIGAASNGTTSVNPTTGVITYTPDASFAGTDIFTYSICDSQPVCDTALVTITVVAPPSAVNDVRTGLAIGAVTDVDVTTNDTGTLSPGSVVLWNPTTLTSITSPYVVSGEGSWTVASDIVTFTPEPGFKGDPAPVTYRVSATNGLTSTATVTLTYIPIAVNDTRSNLAIGAVTTVPVLTNDDGDFTVSTLRLVDPGTGTPTPGPVVVAGEGTWSISGADVVFTPESGFLLDPTPIEYRITDSTGDTVSATVSLDYRPSALDDSSIGNAIGSVVNLDVLANDTGDFDTTTLGFGPGNVGVGATLNVPGQGSWTVSALGVISFTPESGFLGDPTSVSYVVRDALGDATGALMTIAYVPAAADDSDLGNAFGTSVNVAVLANDTGAFVAGSVRIMDGLLAVSSLVVPGEGTWTVERDDTITFDPEPGFLTDPAAIFYRVADTTGDNVSAVVTVTYLPQAADDSDLGNTLGSTINVAVLTNDTGDFVPSSVRIVAPGGPVLELIVAGEGRWQANSDGTVSFFPEITFLLDPAPVDYEVTDVTGDTVDAQVTITFLPTVAPDQQNGLAFGSPAVLTVLNNDTGDFDVSTLRVVDPGTNLGVPSLVVPGEGDWTVDTLLGRLTFTPEPGYLRNPTPVDYEITDLSGDVVRAPVTVTYLPTAADDESLGNVAGSTVEVPILGNDVGLFVTSSARLLRSGTPMMTVSVPGEGVWRMLTTTSEAAFTPLGSFEGDPTPMSYRVADINGNLVTASVTITYLQRSDLALTGMSVDAPLWASIVAIVTGLCVMLAPRLRRVARHRM